ncbi:MAG: DUF2497 domain-containing protein [Bauldia sp.]|uniref:DUF2497 domain-containing protein n=1 Tax=Bauldia sp. TaxID=2575872 RepID=UPI001D216E78|nr:DUF2497 domain-containing protein [Bauldia sp.]MCB1495006.1 DUF2497 domain-containing protein [Bauldia sp.]
MTKSGQAQDEAMDAILASIRSMMSDGEESPAPAAASTDPIPVNNVTPMFSPPTATAMAMPSVQPREEPAIEVEDAPPAGELSEPRRDTAVERAMARAMEEARAEIRRDETAVGESRPDRREEPVRPASVAVVEETGEVGEPAVEPFPASLPPEIAMRDAAPQPLLSSAADAAVSGSFHELATSVLSGSGRTIDDLVEDLLRPMLRDWLDDNLPSMVERLVREEIERVARGRR